MGSSIDSIVACASLKPKIKLEIDRFGVGLLSWSSGPPSDVLDPFFIKRGDDGGLLTLAELDGRRGKYGAFEVRGESLVIGDVAGCDVRRERGVFRPGVGGAEDMGLYVSEAAVATDMCLGASLKSFVSSLMASGGLDSDAACACWSGSVGACDAMVSVFAGSSDAFGGWYD